jgi:hydroxymethylbilane synthase
MQKPIRIGTRGSQLALWQAEWVKSRINHFHPRIPAELVIIKTKGDKILDVPLAQIGGKGLFVKEIENALLSGDIDLAVHSMKDMPGEIPPGLSMGPVPEREMPWDAFISLSGQSLGTLKRGCSVGTSSLRRGAQVRHMRPDLRVVPLRGNLETRIRKLDQGDMDAVLLAAAGLRRLGLDDRITEVLSPSIMLPAVAQGALCIELREDDTNLAGLLAPLDHSETRRVVLGERAFLHRLEGGCQIPIAAHGGIVNNRFSLTGMVADVMGKTMIKDTLAGEPGQSVDIGIQLADRLLSKGGDVILETLRIEGNG